MEAGNESEKKIGVDSERGNLSCELEMFSHFCGIFRRLRLWRC